MSTQPAMPEPTASRKRKVPIDDNGDLVTLVKKKEDKATSSKEK
jgi:hypothetical protein